MASNEDGNHRLSVWARDSSLFTLNHSSRLNPPCTSSNSAQPAVALLILGRIFGLLRGRLGGTWSGMAPDGSVLTVRDVSSHEVYALDVQLP